MALPWLRVKEGFTFRPRFVQHQNTTSSLIPDVHRVHHETQVARREEVLRTSSFMLCAILFSSGCGEGVAKT